jgi:hypothetical protein
MPGMQTTCEPDHQLLHSLIQSLFLKRTHLLLLLHFAVWSPKRLAIVAIAINNIDVNVDEAVLTARRTV